MILHNNGEKAGSSVGSQGLRYVLSPSVRTPFSDEHKEQWYLSRRHLTSPSLDQFLLTGEIVFPATSKNG